MTELAETAVFRWRSRLPASLVVGGVLVMVLLTIAALAQWIAPYPYDQLHIRDRFLPPSLHYLAAPTNMVAMCSVVCCSDRSCLWRSVLLQPLSAWGSACRWV